MAGVVNGDNVQLVNGIPTFDSERTGKDIVIHFTDFVLFGDDEVVANYRLTQPSGITASILEYVSDAGEYSVNSNDWINRFCCDSKRRLCTEPHRSGRW